VPSNNWDALSYHLSRPAYWIQNHSINHYFTHFWGQSIYPLNGEIFFLWTMISSRTDCFAGFIQLAGYLLTGLLIFQGTKYFLNSKTIPALYTAGLWYSLPEVVLESTSCQNDLMAAFFTTAALTYFLLGAKKKFEYLRWSALALGLAAGVKITVVFFIIPFLFLIGYFLIRGTIKIHQVIWYFLTAGLAFMLFSSYNYFQNYSDYGNFFGPKEKIQLYCVNPPSLQKTISNLGQHFFDISSSQSGLGLNPTAGFYNKFAGRLGRWLFRILNIPINIPGAILGPHFSFDAQWRKFCVHEDVSHFGLAGFILIILSGYFLILSLAKAIKISGAITAPAIFGFMFFGYLLSISSLLKWHPWASRYLISAVALGWPVIGGIFNSGKKVWLIFGKILIFYALVGLILVNLHNERKPLKMLKASRQTLRFIDRPKLAAVIKKYLAAVPPGSKVGTYFTMYWGVKDYPDYPLFGEKLNRIVVPVNLNILNSQNFDFLLTTDSSLINPHEPNLIDYIIKKFPAVKNLGHEPDHGRWWLYSILPGAGDSKFE
jgi:4-amino-4-deoxy-L-arabinose transferase-like glycosyltransferase